MGPLDAYLLPSLFRSYLVPLQPHIGKPILWEAPPSSGERLLLPVVPVVISCALAERRVPLQAPARRPLLSSRSNPDEAVHWPLIASGWQGGARTWFCPAQSCLGRGRPPNRLWACRCAKALHEPSVPFPMGLLHLTERSGLRPLAHFPPKQRFSSGVWPPPEKFLGT